MLIVFELSKSYNHTWFDDSYVWTNVDSIFRLFWSFQHHSIYQHPFLKIQEKWHIFLTYQLISSPCCLETHWMSQLFHLLYVCQLSMVFGNELLTGFRERYTQFWVLHSKSSNVTIYHEARSLDLCPNLSQMLRCHVQSCLLTGLTISQAVSPLPCTSPLATTTHTTYVYSYIWVFC
jgi:hypothetical protein